ncbi:toll-like receptor 7 [Bacillus rossius redtenbacheri]|uniref:toll-like receptor 7 n=1 Tax=Bacillus rossius redtenbacheri TaxID=93214 RepID=UPI002FDD42A3
MRALWLLACAVLAASEAAPPRLDAGPCSWTADNDTSGRGLVWCRLRTLDGGAGLGALQAEGTARLRVQCSDLLLFESALPPRAFHRLAQLQELSVEDCKILHLPPDAFDGLRDLKRLAVNTRNAEWGSGKSLEVSPSSLHGLRELQVLDLADNNIRALPEDAYCYLGNLQTLNLTRNRIRHADWLGFGGAARAECGGGLDVRALDASWNQLQILPAGSGLSRLRQLQSLHLQHNELAEIHGDAFDGLASLRVLNLSSNRLETLPEGLFSSAKELREVYLQNNSLYELARGLFRRLEQLLVLDLSDNQLSSSHVDDGTFVGLIRLIVLDLSHNALTRIDSRTFKDLFFLQILDLRNNSIGYIEDNTFLALYNLHTLNLADNRLHHIGSLLFNGLFVLSKLTLNNNLVVSIDSQAFRNCSDLKDLDLSSNVLQEVPEALKELSFLKTLDLGENQISDFQNGSFRNLQQLTGLRLIGNNIGNLSRGMFWDLTSLQVLNLAKNKVQQVERGTFDHNSQIEAIRLDANFLTDINGVFSTLTSLLWLNLSDNHLVWFDYAFVPGNLKWLDIHGNYIERLGNYYKIQEGLNIKTLDASHNRITEISAMSIPNSVELLFINNNFISQIQVNTFLDKRDIVRVDMYANELSKLELNALRLSPVADNRSLPEFYIGGNAFDCDCTMEWLQMINNMSKVRQYPRVMDLDNIVCRMTYSRGLPTLPAVDAKPSHFLCTYETHCFALCHCCDFDACDCEMTCPGNCTCYHDQTWTTNVVDCSGQGTAVIPRRIPMDATELYLDGNSFGELQNHVFIGRKNMRVLFVNASRIESIQNRTFNGLNALQVLHLEDNRIRELKGFEFEHLTHLRELYLQNNVIAHIGNVSLVPLRSLEVLRLDGNRLATFPVWQLNLNGHLAELSLGNNPWSCRCKFLQELQVWVADNARKVVDGDDIWCYNNETRPPQRREVDLNNTACSDYYAGGSVIQSIIVSDYLPMVVITLSAFLLVAVLTVLMFVFREPMRVWAYSRYGVRLFRFKAAGSKHCAEDREKLYDGYVCYSPKDEEFVLQSIVAELEHGSPSFQLCLHYRDLPHHAYLQHASSPVVVEAAEASRRVILVLSRNFLQTEWSRCEFRSALHEALKGRVFKLVLVEQGSSLPEAELDPDLRPYLKTSARVRWGEKRFWERLRYAMPSRDARGKSSLYRRNINNYTLEAAVAGARDPRRRDACLAKQLQPPLFPAAAAEYASQQNNLNNPREAEEANYSSATTATPSPRPHRQQRLEDPGAPRPASEHIYSSIDADYSTLERRAAGVHQPRTAAASWRPAHQSYLV